MWSTCRLSDKEHIQAFLRSDEIYAAYAIGDLEPAMFAHSTFAGAARDGELRALVLHFRGLATPALMMMGDPDGIAAILAAELRPDRVYLTYREEHRHAARRRYRWDSEAPMWRMAVRRENFRPAPTGACVRLGSEHVEQLGALYAWGGGDAFSPSQVELGVFYGVFDSGQLVAAAGTHLVSRTYGIGAVGNVFVHPDYRRMGYGKATTTAVVAELVRLGCRLVILNVAQSNTAAVHLYEGLGFARYCPFLECPLAVAIDSPPIT